jgi:hypothetical protein
MSGDAPGDGLGPRAARRAAQCAAVALLTVVALAGGVVTAAASGADDRATAEKLRQAYPLNPDESGGPRGAAVAGNEAPDDAAPNSRLLLQVGLLMGVAYTGLVFLWFVGIRPRVRYATGLGVSGAWRRVPGHRVAASSGAHAEAVWTCVIGWRAGRVRSRFRAFVAAPDGRRRRVVAQSRTVHWPPRSSESLATADLVSALESLVAALVAAGWEPVESAGSWSARRFIWRHAGRPPGRLRLVQEK